MASIITDLFENSEWSIENRFEIFFLRPLFHPSQDATKQDLPHGNFLGLGDDRDILYIFAGTFIVAAQLQDVSF